MALPRIASEQKTSPSEELLTGISQVRNQYDAIEKTLAHISATRTQAAAQEKTTLDEINTTIVKLQQQFARTGITQDVKNVQKGFESFEDKLFCAEKRPSLPSAAETDRLSTELKLLETPHKDLRSKLDDILMSAATLSSQLSQLDQNEKLLWQQLREHEKILMHMNTRLLSEALTALGRIRNRADAWLANHSITAKEFITFTDSVEDLKGTGGNLKLFYSIQNEIDANKLALAKHAAALGKVYKTKLSPLHQAYCSKIPSPAEDNEKEVDLACILSRMVKQADAICTETTNDVAIVKRDLLDTVPRRLALAHYRLNEHKNPELKMPTVESGTGLMYLFSGLLAYPAAFTVIVAAAALIASATTGGALALLAGLAGCYLAYRLYSHAEQKTQRAQRLAANGKSRALQARLVEQDKKLEAMGASTEDRELAEREGILLEDSRPELFRDYRNPLPGGDKRGLVMQRGADGKQDYTPVPVHFSRVVDHYTNRMQGLMFSTIAGPPPSLSRRMADIKNADEFKVELAQRAASARSMRGG